jgi:hypothetical protein
MTNNLYRIIKNNYQIILDRYKELRTNAIKEKLYIDDIKYNKDTKVAIIVPYRDTKLQDRASQLKQFSEYYHNYLDNIDIYIIEQSDDGKKFNRGCLLNCGFELAKKDRKVYAIMSKEVMFLEFSDFEYINFEKIDSTKMFYIYVAK